MTPVGEVFIELRSGLPRGRMGYPDLWASTHTLLLACRRVSVMFAGRGMENGKPRHRTSYGSYFLGIYVSRSCRLSSE
jgi:hypothetical protein